MAKAKTQHRVGDAGVLVEACSQTNGVGERQAKGRDGETWIGLSRGTRADAEFQRAQGKFVRALWIKRKRKGLDKIIEPVDHAVDASGPGNSGSRCLPFGPSGISHWRTAAATGSGPCRWGNSSPPREASQRRA
jgi:hypothetical protein